MQVNSHYCQINSCHSYNVFTLNGLTTISRPISRNPQLFNILYYLLAILQHNDMHHTHTQGISTFLTYKTRENHCNEVASNCRVVRSLCLTLYDYCAIVNAYYCKIRVYSDIHHFWHPLGKCVLSRLSSKENIITAPCVYQMLYYAFVTKLAHATSFWCGDWFVS